MAEPPVTREQIDQIIRLCEARPPARSRQQRYKEVARAVGCSPLQARYQWRRYLRFRAAQKHAAIDLKREIADAVANRASEPYLGGHWKTW